MNSFTGIARRKFSRNWRSQLRLLSTASPVQSEEIQIPLRIERGPTDILKALASTVKWDPLAAPYKYHDDPFLVPQGKLQNRTYALAVESGRKTAMWIRSEHADLFQHRVAEPIIPAFLPEPEYTEKSQVSEEILLNEILKGNIDVAVNVYNLLKEDASTNAKQCLLEALCFYNDKKPLTTFDEERWQLRPKTPKRNVWVDIPLIQELFKFLITQDNRTAAAAYNAMICGMAKHGNAAQAWDMYDECRAKSIPLNLAAYNSVIRMIPFLRDGLPQQLSLINNLLIEMCHNGIRPDTNTLNATLKIIPKMKSAQKALSYVRTMFAEFLSVGVKPSLESYYCALLLSTEIGESTGKCIVDILDILEKEPLEVYSEDDTMFFTFAMEVISQYICNRSLGDRLHKLVTSGNNLSLLGNSINENMYYRWYTALVMTTAPSLKEFMEFYRSLVPRTYSPDATIIHDIVQKLKLESNEIMIEFLPLLWSHTVLFGYMDRSFLLTDILNLMTNHCKLPDDSPLHKFFGEAAQTAWNHLQKSREKSGQHVTWSAMTMADIITLLLRKGELLTPLNILQDMVNRLAWSTEKINSNQLAQILDMFVAQGSVAGAMLVMEYASTINSDNIGLMARQVNSSLSLDSVEIEKLTNLVGADVLLLQLHERS